MALEVAAVTAAVVVVAVAATAVLAAAVLAMVARRLSGARGNGRGSRQVVAARGGTVLAPVAVVLTVAMERPHMTAQRTSGVTRKGTIDDTAAAATATAVTIT